MLSRLSGVSLRMRLVLGLLGLVAVGLVVSDAVTYTSLRAFLVHRVDQQLQASADDASRVLIFGDRGPGDGDRRAAVPVNSYAELRDSRGQVLARTRFGFVTPNAEETPQLPAKPPQEPFTVRGDQYAHHYRVLAEPTPAGGGTVLFAIPLSDVDSILSRLLWLELLITAAVLGGLGGSAWWTVRLGLRPLERMEETAGAIAGGDLARRVEPATERTEVGRLGLALNSMLGQIEGAFAERTASENRLRRFIADASHELRTPLTSIRGYAELFRRGAGQRPEDLAKAMRRIEDESARMSLLVDDLLLLARLDQGRPLERAPVDLGRLLQDACDDARTVAPHRTVTCAAAPAVVLGDEARLRQVLGNLVQNALVHTPASSPVELLVTTDGATARLAVRDHGPGLGEPEAAKVFERFYRADASRSRDRGGTGLGLSIVAAIAEAHGGRAGYEPTPGGGATFWVSLPALAVRETEPHADLGPRAR